MITLSLRLNLDLVSLSHDLDWCLQSRKTSLLIGGRGTSEPRKITPISRGNNPEGGLSSSSYLLYLLLYLLLSRKCLGNIHTQCPEQQSEYQFWSSCQSHTKMSVMSKSSISPTLGRRRNGLAPACEPCRKSKIRCDTTPSQPICARCSKRNSPSKCIFLQAPMTRRYSPGASIEPRPLPTPRSPAAVLPTGNVQSPSAATVTTISSNSRKLAESLAFFGSTSFSATIHHSDLDPDIEGEANEHEEIAIAPDLDPTQVAMGANVIRRLPNYATCNILIESYSEQNSSEMGFPKPTTRRILESLYKTHQTHLKLPRLTRGLERMSMDITRNCIEPLHMPDDAEEWMSSFTGPNTRWEAIGILFSSLAYGLMSVTEKEFRGLCDPISKKEKNTSIQEFKECVMWCIELCRQSLNPLVCTLLYRHLLLETVINGDSSWVAPMILFGTVTHHDSRFIRLAPTSWSRGSLICHGSSLLSRNSASHTKIWND